MRTSKYNESLQKEMADMCEEHGPRRAAVLLEAKHGQSFNPGLVLWYYRKWKAPSVADVRWKRKKATANAS